MTRSRLSQYDPYKVRSKKCLCQKLTEGFVSITPKITSDLRKILKSLQNQKTVLRFAQHIMVNTVNSRQVGKTHSLIARIC